MLVISNGAFKSGSTWLFNILTTLRDFAWPDSAFLTNSNAAHPTIAESKLEAYLATEDFRSKSIISKNHLEKPKHRILLLSKNAIRVVCMTRDSRDVIVSSYFDECRRGHFEGSFEKYYWEEGRVILPKIACYSKTWAEPHRHIESTSFEALKADFHGEVSRLAGFLGLSLDANRIDDIEQETSLDALREKYRDASSHRTEKADFFRKGESGDWRNHFDDNMLADHDRICENGLPRLDRHLMLRRLKQGIYRRFV
jgi:hypothetical protein